MSRLDLVIFGATGFTGKHAVMQMVKFAKKYEVSWGVAGRSETKLQDMMVEVSQKTGEDVSGIIRIVADIKDEDSLKAMCAQCKVVVNCCGPYRLYGEPVVKAAILNKTHYVDVSGEPQFMERMQLVYNEEARAAGSTVISACGFDSVPADLGTVFLQHHFTGTVNSVESYLSAGVSPEYFGQPVINYGTWESLVYGVANHHELHSLRKKLYPEKLPSFSPKVSRKLMHRKDGAWYLPFLGADESVVYRTQRYLHDQNKQRPVQYRAYFKAGGLLKTLVYMAMLIFLYLMTKFEFSRKLLLNHPRWFTLGMVSHKGPSDKVMNSTKFDFELVGRGWESEQDVGKAKPKKKLVVKVSGTNPGYGATVVSLLLCAITLLKERDHLPARGGVYTPGIAFKNTDIIKHLTENDLKFEVVDTK